MNASGDGQIQLTENAAWDDTPAWSGAADAGPAMAVVHAPGGAGVPTGTDGDGASDDTNGSGSGRQYSTVTPAISRLFTDGGVHLDGRLWPARDQPDPGALYRVASSPVPLVVCGVSRRVRGLEPLGDPEWHGSAVAGDWVALKRGGGGGKSPSSCRRAAEWKRAGITAADAAARIGAHAGHDHRGARSCLRLPLIVPCS